MNFRWLNFRSNGILSKSVGRTLFSQTTFDRKIIWPKKKNCKGRSAELNFYKNVIWPNKKWLEGHWTEKKFGIWPKGHLIEKSFDRKQFFEKNVIWPKVFSRKSH
jgi:hypothetical protein